MTAIDSPKSQTPATSHNASLVIAAPGAGVRNYLEDLSVLSDTDCVLTIQSNAVTIFQVSLKANMGFDKSWLRGLPAPTQNTDLTIAVTAGNFDINVVSVTA